MIVQLIVDFFAEYPAPPGSDTVDTTEAGEVIGPRSCSGAEPARAKWRELPQLSQSGNLIPRAVGGVPVAEEEPEALPEKNSKPLVEMKISALNIEIKGFEKFAAWQTISLRRFPEA
jgi:hypothetical protein